MTEKLIAATLVRFLYGPLRENSPALFRALTSARATDFLAAANMDLPKGRNAALRFAQSLGVDLSECVDPPSSFKSARDVFTRRIRYEKFRPMPSDESVVVSPADSRMICGSFSEDSRIFVKEKFFSFYEILGTGKHHWLSSFEGGDFAVFRLTPDKYHYSHSPVSGMVADIYAIDGAFHSCNPDAVVAECTPHSKNRRTVTVIETDVPGGTGVGLVAMIEVCALMIGKVEQCYSPRGYEEPVRVSPGLFIERGQPKSLYHPGSSTDILLFQKGRVKFCPDILENLNRADVSSRFSKGFGRSLVETEVRVREEIAFKSRA